jgi:chromosome segregation ATPase
MSEALAGSLFGSSSREGKVRRPRRRTRRLQARIDAHEHELLRRQQTALSLATETRRLRAALTSALNEGARLEAELARLAAERSEEATAANSLAEAVLGQQVAVRELERAVAVVLAGRV